MKFKQFLLLEDNALEDLPKLFKGKFSDAYDAYKSGVEMYRGTMNKSFKDKSWIIQDKSKWTNVERRPRMDKAIQWNELREIVPAWKKFPDRDSSIFFTNNKKHATQFGILTRVFPCNGAKIAALETDFNYIQKWPSMVSLLNTTNVISNRSMNELIFILAILSVDPIEARTMGSMVKPGLPGKWLLKNYDKVQKALDKIPKDKEIEVFKKRSSEYSIALVGHDRENSWHDTMYYNMLFKRFDGKLDKFFELFDPDKNGFGVYKTNEVENSLKSTMFSNDAMEFWTEDECLIIPEDSFKIYEKDKVKD
jgi:hypothetical protein